MLGILYIYKLKFETLKLIEVVKTMFGSFSVPVGCLKHRNIYNYNIIILLFVKS